MDLPMHGAFILHRVFEMSGMSHSRSPARKLVELVGADDARKTSPYCWRIRFALAQKQLQYESVPWRRVEKEAIGFTGQGKVPVLIDGKQVMHDSWEIAEYLELQCPHQGSLFASEAGHHAIRFTIHWVDQCLLPAIRNIVALGAIEVSADKDKEYYTDKLQNTHKVLLQDAGGSCSNLSHLHTILEPMRLTLREQSFLGGQAPSFADLAAAGAFAWARAVSPIQLLQEDDPLYAWRERVFQQFKEDLSSCIGYPLTTIHMCRCDQINTIKDTVSSTAVRMKSLMPNLAAHKR